MKKTTALLTAGMLLVLSLTGCGAPANTVFKAEDLEGKTIGAQLGTTGYIFAESEVKDAKVEPYNKGADAVQALKQGKVDAVIIDSEPAKIFEKRMIPCGSWTIHLSRRITQSHTRRATMNWARSWMMH